MTRSVIFLGCFLLASLSMSAKAGDKKSEPMKQEIPDVVLFFDTNETDPKEQTMRFGLIVTTERDPTTPTKYKQLTYHPRGLTNNVCVKIDGKESLFGHPPGKWLNPEIRLGKDNMGKPRLGLSSLYGYEDKIEIMQTAEIRRGALTGKRDTCLILYEISNKDTKAHKVGLRFLLDTFIGRNDGAPFIVPGKDQLMEGEADYRGAAVPAFVQAIESPRLQEPGTIAQLDLQPTTKVERAGRLTLGGWPDARTSIKGANDGLTLWEVPLFSMRKLEDSAAVLYWPEKQLQPGEKRLVGFSYGLGRFTGEEKGRLGMLLHGKPQVGSELTIMALIRNPKKEESITLRTSNGMKLVGSNAKQKVYLPQPDGTQITTLTWQVRLTTAGEIPIVLESSEGSTHREIVRVSEKKNP